MAKWIIISWTILRVAMKTSSKQPDGTASGGNSFLKNDVLTHEHAVLTRNVIFKQQMIKHDDIFKNTYLNGPNRAQQLNGPNRA